MNAANDPRRAPGEDGPDSDDPVALVLDAAYQSQSIDQVVLGNENAGACVVTGHLRPPSGRAVGARAMTRRRRGKVRGGRDSWHPTIRNAVARFAAHGPTVRSARVIGS